MKSLKEFKTIFSIAKNYKFRIIISSILIVLGSISFILVGYLNGKAIEEVTKSNLKGALIALLLYLVIEIVFNLIDRLSMTALIKVELKISREVAFLTYKKSLALPAVAFEEKSSGEFINRITSDTGTIINSFDHLLRIGANLISTTIILVFIFINSYIIGIEIMIFVIIYGLIVRYFNPLMKDIHKERKEEGDKLTGIVNESIRGIREIQTLGIKRNLFTIVKERIKILTGKSDKEIDIHTKYDIVSNILKALLEVGTFITCAFLIYRGNITLTFFVAMTYYIYRFTWLIENITSFSKIYNQVVVSLQRVNEILENKLYKDTQYGDKEIKECKGVIKFDNVEFAYPNEPNTLKGLTLEFKPNKKIAIVGKSGQGKSTIFNLLTRIFDTEKGEITIDGINIKDLTEESLRNNLSIIRQEPFLFNRTIKENFQLVKEDISIEEIKKYCKLAYIDEYIESLPNKYDTILGEGGVNLSGGQKQRLSIARSLAKESKIILFDEATSSLDNESQNYIKEVIDNLVKEHTIIVVAHRLSTIIDSDEIYIIDKGKLADCGTHKELLKKSSFYKKLYEGEEQSS